MMDPRVSRDGARAVVTAPGDVVAATTADLRPVLRNLVRDGVRELVVDLSAARMVDSSGIGLLIAAHNSLAKVGGSLSVIQASGDLVDLFRSVRLHQHFSIAGA